MAKIFVTIGIIFYAIIVPILEINDSHVFNPQWPPHARLHEVWQLFTNTSMGIVGLWLLWFCDNVRVPCLFTFFVFGGFLMSYVTGPLYGGSMLLSDGTVTKILGINIGVLGGAISIALATLALDMDRRAKNPSLLEL